MNGYSFQNTLNELLENEQTKAILFAAIPQLEGNPMLAQAGKMPFSAIIGFMGGAIPAAYLEKIEAQLKTVPLAEASVQLPEVEMPDAPYFDAKLPVDQRVEDLLSRMTLEEKLAQLCSDMVNSLMGLSQDALPQALYKEHPHGLGRYTQYSVAGLGSARQAAELANRLQEYYCKHTRLGIPVTLQTENLSGYPGAGGTIFPSMLNAAAAFDEKLVEQTATAIGQETRAVGMAQGLSPVLDLARDQRWGRVYETFGEDPYLASQMGKAYVKGMQGAGVLATGKHFLGYSVTQAGLNLAATRLCERELYDEYAMPFEAAIREAGLASVMTSYSEINGIPCGMNKKIVRGLLREKLGFDGLVVSDGAAVHKLYETYHVASSYEEAGLLGIQGGMETEMPVGDSYRKLDEYVRSGELDVQLIDEAVRHVLHTKFAAGLFENPYVDAENCAQSLNTETARQLSRQLAAESLTLLKNDEILPLQKGKKLAVIGPHGNFLRPGVTGYTFPAYCEMIRGMSGKDVGEVTFHGMADERRRADAQGKEWTMDAILSDGFSVEEALHVQSGAGTLADELACDFTTVSAVGCKITGEDVTGIPEAVETARQCDTVILTLGGNCGWVGTTGGEGKDRTHLGLPGIQQRLLDTVAQAGKDIVLVLYGPACYTPKLPANVKAVLYAWLPGPYGGKAIADVLTGRSEPMGRLPVTVPRCAGQIPIYYSHKTGSGYTQIGNRTGINAVSAFDGGYTDELSTPLYPFGYGMSYTSFSVGALTPVCDSVPTDGTITLNCTVTNTGKKAGSTVVQLYFRDMEAHVTRPVKQLCGYVRVTLEPGQTAQISFEVDCAQLGFTNENDEFVVEPGRMTFWAGEHSEALDACTEVTLTGRVRNLEGNRKFTSTAKWQLMV